MFLLSPVRVDANLSGANLTRANLSWANMTGANLTGADVSWAYSTDLNLSGATRADGSLHP